LGTSSRTFPPGGSCVQQLLWMEIMNQLQTLLAFLDVKPSTFVHVVTESDRVHETPEMIDELAELGKFPKLIQLWPAIVVAIALSICRLALQKFIFKVQLGASCLSSYRFILFLSSHSSRGFFVWMSWMFLPILSLTKLSNKTIDQRYFSSLYLSHLPFHFILSLPFQTSELKALSAETSLSAETIHKEFMIRRRSKVQNKKYTKFVEAAWRFIFYSVFTILGYFTLFVPSPVPWVLESKEHWNNWPVQEIFPMVKIYYLVELGAYFHQLAWTEINRSDSLEMIAHHLITIALLLSSHVLNFVRIGVTVLFIHDISDVFLEFAKCFNYISKVKGQKWASTVCDILFAIFAISFFILRLVIYPYWIFYTSYVDATEIFGQNWFGFDVFYWLLLSLQALHVFWFYLICRMIYRLLTTGIEKDERSDDDCEEEDGDHSHASSQDSQPPLAHKKSSKKKD
jgi:sphingoid base N-palmitoyltransferase